MSTKNSHTETKPADEGKITYTEWTRQAVENLGEAEKKWMDLASEQNALTLKALQESQELYRKGLNLRVAERVNEGLDSLLEVQKRWSENITQQAELFLQNLKQAVPFDPNTNAASVAKSLNEFGKQQAELFIESEERWIDFASQQNAQVLEGARKAFGLPEYSLANSVNRWVNQSVHNYIGTQKRFLKIYTSYSKQA